MTTKSMVEADKEKVEVRDGGRRDRVPLGTPRMKLSISKAMQEYFEGRNEVARWINDEPGRLEAASEEDTYRFVTKREFPGTYRVEVGQGDLTAREGIDSRISRVVGTREGGQPVTAYLMAKPKEDYEADQRDKMKLVSDREDAMRQGIDSQGRPGVGGRYIPSTGIKITHS
jgi:hypothetical protein